MKQSIVIQHFEAFGKIEHLEFRNRNGIGFGIIQFEKEGCLRDISQKRYYRIEKYIISVKPYSGQLIEIFFDTKFDTKMPHFLNLNDNCLVDVFGYLDEYSLAAVATTCTRFKPIAEQTFSTNFPEYKLYLCEAFEKELLCEAFSHLISRMIVSHEFESFINCINKYPFNSLRSLSLRGDFSKLTIHDKIKLESIFANLHDFEIVDFSYGQIGKNLLLACSELRKLHIDSSNEKIWNILTIHLPKLEYFEFCDSINEDRLEQFLAINRGIKTLNFRWCLNLSVKICKIIADFLPNIEHLTFALTDDCDFLRELGKLKYLKTLHIDSYFTFDMIDPIKDVLQQAENLSELAIRIYFDFGTNTTLGTEWLKNFVDNHCQDRKICIEIYDQISRKRIGYGR